MHIKQTKKAEIKGGSIYTVNQSPKVKNAKVGRGSRNSGKSVYRQSTLHIKRDVKNDGMNVSYRTRKKPQIYVKRKGEMIKIAGLAGAKYISEQMEGGKEVQQAAMLAYGITGSAKKVISRGTERDEEKLVLEQRYKEEQKKSSRVFAKKPEKKADARVPKTSVKETLWKSTKIADNENVSANTQLSVGEMVKTNPDTSVKRHRNNADTSLKKSIHKNTVISVKKSARKGIKTVRRPSLQIDKETVKTRFAREPTGNSLTKTADRKVKQTGTARVSRSRKINFFIDKMKAEERQTDSIAKLAKDLIANRAFFLIKKAVVAIGGFSAGIFLLIAVACLPVVLTVTVIYNSPFAVFFPALEAGDTVMTVTKQHEIEFNRKINVLASQHIGYSDGVISYMNYEGSSAVPSNYYDVIAVYMVKYGIGDTATIMNSKTKSNLKKVFEDMCSYTTSTKLITVENDDGTISVITILSVNVTLKSYHDMIEKYDFTKYEAELLEEMMKSDNLALLGYTENTGNSQDMDNGRGSALSDAEITDIVSSITDVKARQAVSFALTKVGYPYSQAYRDSGNYYDCSSLVYYSWKSAGYNLAYEGSNTAAQEGKYFSDKSYTVNYSEIQPGDVIFYSYCINGRFMNISHVAIYVGNGMCVEAANESIGVVYREVKGKGSIVLVGRPQ